MKKTVFSILVSLIGFFSYGQGCSDAGFCTLEVLKPNADALSQNPNKLKVGATVGSADNSISAIGSYLEFVRMFNTKWNGSVKVTTLAQSGNGISQFGISDLFANVGYKATERTDFTLGFKIPLSSADASKDGLPLPMDYQSSLGTFDLIAGIGYKWKQFRFAAAFQQPLTQNDNRFLASAYPEDSKLNDFQSTNKFERSGDALVRASYVFDLGKFKITPGALGIYHLANDTFTDELDIEREIDGSRGLTLNGNLFVDYIASETSSVQLTLAAPFVVRDTRPDGLTRSFVVALEYRIGF